MTGGWAATNTLREALPSVQGLDGVQCQCVSCELAASRHAALALVETALDAAEYARRMLSEPYDLSPREMLDHIEQTENALAAALRAVREGR